MLRPKTAQDGPTPAGNGTVITVLARLHLLTGASRYRELADHVLETFSGDAVRNPAVHTSLLDGLTHFAQPFQAVVIGNPDDAVLHQFRATLLGAPLPPTTTTTSAPGTSLPDGHPAAGKGQIDGVTTTYVCPGHSCLPPIVSLNDLRETIAIDRLRPALAAV